MDSKRIRRTKKLKNHKKLQKNHRRLQNPLILFLNNRLIKQIIRDTKRESVRNIDQNLQIKHKLSKNHKISQLNQQFKRRILTTQAFKKKSIIITLAQRGNIGIHKHNNVHNLFDIKRPTTEEQNIKTNQLLETLIIQTPTQISPNDLILRNIAQNLNHLVLLLVIIILHL